MHGLIIFLYFFDALLTCVMGATFAYDAYCNHFHHRPMRPLVVWASAQNIMFGLLLFLLGIARTHRTTVGSVPAWLDSPLYSALLIGLTLSIVGFYVALRKAR